MAKTPFLKVTVLTEPANFTRWANDERPGGMRQYFLRYLEGTLGLNVGILTHEELDRYWANLQRYLPYI